MRDEFAWHSNILTNRLRFISLFVDINEMVKRIGKSLELGESAEPFNTERVLNLDVLYVYFVIPIF